MVFTEKDLPLREESCGAAVVEEEAEEEEEGTASCASVTRQLHGPRMPGYSIFVPESLIFVKIRVAGNSKMVKT